MVAAFELLHEMSLTEEAVTCLFAAGRQSQAIDIAFQFLDDQEAKARFNGSNCHEESKTTTRRSISQANIMCCLGDMR